ncbi:CHASE2 domain-containing protein [Baaleninema sp.]|uniref:CHASE2 domain-containing protein n=1 Tax=Baaleninema sp. TaxID=3101197 RepID=UPI003CFC07BA
MTDPIGMYSKIRQLLDRWKTPFAIGSAVAVATAAATATGVFQLLEWAALDSFFRLRPSEAIDDRLLIVTIDERDLQTFQDWPLPDRVLARAIENLQQDQPAAIGLDIYRDLPVEPGHGEFAETLKTTPNLIGVEKIAGEPVPPPPALAGSDRVGFVDLVLDGDGKVRRALLSHPNSQGELQLSFAVRLAALYLEARNVEFKAVGSQGQQLAWGQARFVPLQPHQGGYVNAPTAGYQILLNYRGILDRFDRVSLLEVFEGDVSPHLVRDRIVLIGSTATSLNDLFSTPYSTPLTPEQTRTSGVVVHANIVSQLLSAALDGRALLRPLPRTGTWIWMAIVSWGSALVTWHFLDQQHHNSVFLTLSSLAVGGGLLLGGYGLFLWGWWVPVVSPLVALFATILVTTSAYSYHLQRLVATDSLTQVGNRYACDRFLENLWTTHRRKNRSFSVILCDVDFFKRYNDTYGHLAGDACLKQIARAMSRSVRGSDFLARYGGEEFIVILPNTKLDDAIGIARRICENVRALNIDHTSSLIRPIVTLSCGVACSDGKSFLNPKDSIEAADRALYLAKAEGRDRYCTYVRPPIPQPPIY